MKAVRDCIAAKLPLTIPDLKDTRFHRRDDWHVEARYLWDPAKSGSATVEETVFLEAGFRGGANPFAEVTLNSMVGEFILGQQLEGQESLLDYREDFTPFSVELLSPARTFFEKLLHIYSSLRGDVGRLKTRHIYDVVQIFRRQAEVRKLVVSDGFHPLLREAIEVSNRWYDAGLDPADVKIHEGLVISPEQTRKLSAAYAQDVVYYYRGQPPFEDLQRGLEEIRAAFAK
jgi:hypothetical protein